MQPAQKNSPLHARHDSPLHALLTSEKYIAVLFLISGFSALIYQVVWQRVLFTTFGINSEAVTVIVSVFMFGLGIGALAGGWLQKKAPHWLLQIFLLLEVSIGVFGLFSLDLIHYVSRISSTTSTGGLVLWTYAILALPTLLMGATLPVLVAYLQRYFDNLGKTIGLLYAFNTIGSAIAAFCTVQILFVFLGQASSVLIAAACNLATALLIFDANRRLKRAPRPAGSANPANLSASAQNDQPQGAHAPLPYAFVFASLAAIGYISLSQEIVWYRLLGFLTGGKPQVFGLLLTAFLIGIALGALQSKKICERGRDPHAYLVQALLLAALVFYLAVPAVSYATAHFGKTIGPFVGYFMIALVAFYTGGILPMLIHVGVVEGKEGVDSTQAMSWLYFANIIGATFGPMLTGFILLDLYSMEGNVVILTALTLLLLLAVLIVIPKSTQYKFSALGLMCAAVLGGWLAHDALFQGHLEKLQYAQVNPQPFKFKLENRASIITVESGVSDVVYGGGIYDGRFNLDPVLNNNLIDRAFMVAAMHRKPQKILEIGLSSGSWTKVLTDYQPLQKLSVVEINKGYPEITKNYPETYAALKHPKVELFFDDGRRWLRNHPQEKFDFIVMNTTYYWRSNSTNLLSRDFLEICKAHLNPGGVVYYNTTSSRDVVYTAARVFPNVIMFRNFVAASDAPFDMTPAEKRQNLLQFVKSDGTPLFAQDQQHLKLLEVLSNFGWKNIHDSVLQERGLQLITDDNMAVEYKVK